MIVLGKRRDSGRWQWLEVSSVQAVRPDGAWSTVLEVIPRAASSDPERHEVEVIEYRVPPPVWAEVNYDGAPQ